jgi:hypothetical protein
MYIIGAGMAGLIAGHVFRRHTPMIIEAQAELPRNHEALLRFRSSRVGEATGVQFKKATVRKGVVYKDQYIEAPNIFTANMYSRKVIGEVRGRSIWNLDAAERWIAPPDFTEQMMGPLNFQFNTKVDDIGALRILAASGPVISTIPMPVLMNIVGWNDKPRFGSLPIWSTQLEVMEPIIDVYQTIYYPDPDVPYYRASMTGNRLIVEYCREPSGDDTNAILADFGIIGWGAIEPPTPKKQMLGKIAPINDDARKDFIYTMTREFNVYSLGRFATWKQVLLDDVLDDCKVIERLIAAEGKRSAYHQSLEAAGVRRH